MKKPRAPLLAAAGSAVLGLGAYALLIEPRWVRLRRHRIHVRSLPEPLEGLRVGLLSDLHVRGRRSLGVVRRAVRLLQHAAPDLVAITGDLAEDPEGLQEVLDALLPLDPPLGMFVVPGNHDHIAGIDGWHEAVRARKAVRDLTNRYVLLDRHGAVLCVAGVDDSVEGRPRMVLPPPGARDLTILLAHSPDQAERCRRAYDDVDLVLTGHTHGGQVRFPFIGAPVSASRYPDLYQEGLRRRPWTQVFTSRGVGTSRLPVRFLTPPEATLLQLTRRPREPR